MGPAAEVPGPKPAHRGQWRHCQRRRRPAGSAEAAAATQLAVQELHRGVEDRAQAEAETRGTGGTEERPRWREGDRGVGGAAPAQQHQGGARGWARGRCYGAAVQGQAPARGGTGQGRLGGGVAVRIGSPHRPSPGLRASRVYLHKHAAVRWDLERPRTAREAVLRVRQLQTKKGSAQPGPGRRRERGLWRGERVAQEREDELSLGSPGPPPAFPAFFGRRMHLWWRIHLRSALCLTPSAIKLL